MMATKKVGWVLAAAAIACAGCGGGTSGNDAGDTGSTPDVQSPADTGSGSDTGTATDSGEMDAASGDDGAADAQGGTDAGTIMIPGPDGGTFGACSDPAMYQTGTTDIAFGGTTLGNMYSPKCLTVHVNDTVTWTGDFSFHPLRPSTFGTQPNLVPSNDTGTSATATFTAPGFYPYFCQFHGDNTGIGMSGVIQVVP